MVKSEKYIDDIISAELDELQKFYTPRRSQLVNVENGQQMDTETEYYLITTKRGGIKKIAREAVVRGNRGFGKFANGDYLFIPAVRNAVEDKLTEIQAYVVKDGALVPFTLQMGDLTEDEREIILKGCLINYNRR